MKFLKHFSLSFLALAATAATAATQPFTATSASVTLDMASITANLGGYSIAAISPATLDSVAGVLTDPVQAISTSANPGPLLINFSSTGGLKFTKALNPTITMSNFSFNLADNSLYADLLVGSTALPLLNLKNQSLLTAANVSSSFGNEVGTSVTTSAATRTLGLDATNFALSESLNSLLAEAGLDPKNVAFVGGMIKEIKVGTVAQVPEPSTYALMGVGLVGVALSARRKKKAA